MRGGLVSPRWREARQQRRCLFGRWLRRRLLLLLLRDGETWKQLRGVFPFVANRLLFGGWRRSGSGGLGDHVHGCQLEAKLVFLQGARWWCRFVRFAVRTFSHWRRWRLGGLTSTAAAALYLCTFAAAAVLSFRFQFLFAGCSIRIVVWIDRLLDVVIWQRSLPFRRCLGRRRRQGLARVFVLLFATRVILFLLRTWGRGCCCVTRGFRVILIESYMPGYREKKRKESSFTCLTTTTVTCQVNKTLLSTQRRTLKMPIS